MTGELRIGLGVDAHALAAGSSTRAGRCHDRSPARAHRAFRWRCDRTRAHRCAPRRRRARRHRRPLSLGGRGVPRRRLPRTARRGVPSGARGRLRARQCRLCADRPGAANRAHIGWRCAIDSPPLSGWTPAGSAFVRRPPTSSGSPDGARGWQHRPLLCFGATRESQGLHLRRARPSLREPQRAFSALPARCARSRSTLRRASGPTSSPMSGCTTRSADVSRRVPGSIERVPG